MRETPERLAMPKKSMKIDLDPNDPDETLDWDLDEREKWLDENDLDDLDDPTEIVVEADE